MACEIIEVLRPIREKFNNFVNEPAYLESVLETGARKAETHAQKTWQDVMGKIGLESCYAGENKKLASQRQIL